MQRNICRHPNQFIFPYWCQSWHKNSISKGFKIQTRDHSQRRKHTAQKYRQHIVANRRQSLRKFSSLPNHRLKLKPLIGCILTNQAMLWSVRHLKKWSGSDSCDDGVGGRCLSYVLNIGQDILMWHIVSSWLRIIYFIFLWRIKRFISDIRYIVFISNADEKIINLSNPHFRIWTVLSSNAMSNRHAWNLHFYYEQ